jgi:ABC-type lipoprotein export system ATPase subunit
VTTPGGGPPSDAAQQVQPPGPIRVFASGLRLRLGGRDVLDGLDIAVRSGELVAVSGPSGVGKTTLLLVLAGVLTPDAGVVELTGGERRSPEGGGADPTGGESGSGRHVWPGSGSPDRSADDRSRRGFGGPVSGGSSGNRERLEPPGSESSESAPGRKATTGPVFGAPRDLTQSKAPPFVPPQAIEPPGFDPFGSPDIPAPASSTSIPGPPGGRWRVPAGRSRAPGDARQDSGTGGAGSADGRRRHGRYKSRDAARLGSAAGITAGGGGEDPGWGRERGSLSPRQVGFVPQTFGLAPSLTAAENVALVMQVLGLPPDVIEQRTVEVLGAVGLAAVSDRIVTELSGGQRQRVAVARALAAYPAVIIADEPTAELDAENRSLMLELLLDAADAGAAVVLATHDPEVTRRCTRLLVLSEGRFVTAP